MEWNVYRVMHNICLNQIYMDLVKKNIKLFLKFGSVTRIFGPGGPPYNFVVETRLERNVRKFTYLPLCLVFQNNKLIYPINSFYICTCEFLQKSGSIKIYSILLIVTNWLIVTQGLSQSSHPLSSPCVKILTTP